MEIETYYDMYRLIKKEHYLDCLKEVQAKALARIRGQEKIRIAFQSSCLAEWVGDELVRKFAANERFDVTVVIVWQANTDFDKEIPALIEHFELSGLPYRLSDGSVKPGDFDIVFYTSPYMEILSHWLDRDIPLSTLVCYIPYGFYLADIQKMQFNLFAHHICWKNFTLAKGYDIMAERYSDVGKYGMVYSGYPKLDGLLDPACASRASWKIAGEDSVKKIIFAPHHSIAERPYYATFAENHRFFLEYARQNQANTSWVFKPHPMLGLSCVKNGVFSSLEEYDAYCRAWDALPNAKVVTGEYLAYFASSDAMILDSVSFMAEYLYVHKPALFLTREGERFNEFGEMIVSVLYRAAGTDYASVEHFLDVLLESDPLRETRENFFRQVLDYADDHGKSATQFIYDDIVHAIGV